MTTVRLNALGASSGRHVWQRLRPTAAWALAPAAAVLFAFWLLPLAQLMLLGGQSRAGSDSGSITNHQVCGAHFRKHRTTHRNFATRGTALGRTGVDLPAISNHVGVGIQ